MNAATVNGYSIVTYQRPLKATDEFDLPIIGNSSQAIAWAIGPLNQRLEVSFHSLFSKATKLIQFGREPSWNCPLSENDMKMMEPDENEELYEPPTQQSGHHHTQAYNQHAAQHNNYEELESVSEVFRVEIFKNDSIIMMDKFQCVAMPSFRLIDVVLNLLHNLVHHQRLPGHRQ